jgi:hypothetical protein
MPRLHVPHTNTVDGAQLKVSRLYHNEVLRKSFALVFAQLARQGAY